MHIIAEHVKNDNYVISIKNVCEEHKQKSSFIFTLCRKLLDQFNSPFNFKMEEKLEAHNKKVYYFSKMLRSTTLYVKI